LDLFNHYATAPTSTYFYNEFTIIIWFNRYFVFIYDSIALFDFSFDNSHNIGLTILNNNYVFFWTKNSTGSIISTLDSNYKINNQKWYHIAITYSNNSKSLYLYINGFPIFFRNIDLILGETNLNYIGRSDTLKIAGSEILIDEIRIYNRALNSNEIKIDSDDRPITTTTRATTTIDKCKNYYCYNGGTCYTYYYGDVYCRCTSNYYGDKCQYSNLYFS